MIITDSVFSMEGTIADLVSITRLARTHGCRLFVDESHAVGVFGENGRGIAELQGIDDEVDIINGHVQQAFAGLGGFITGRSELVDFIKAQTVGPTFSRPACLRLSSQRSCLSRHHSPRARAAPGPAGKGAIHGCRAAGVGYDAPYHGSQIVPVILGNYTLALSAYKRFMDKGVYRQSRRPAGGTGVRRRLQNKLYRNPSLG